MDKEGRSEARKRKRKVYITKNGCGECEGKSGRWWSFGEGFFFAVVGLWGSCFLVVVLLSVPRN